MLDTLLKRELIEEKLNDLMTPGATVEVNPLEADDMGAFVEDALTENDAKESSNG